MLSLSEFYPNIHLQTMNTFVIQIRYLLNDDGVSNFNREKREIEFCTKVNIGSIGWLILDFAILPIVCGLGVERRKIVFIK